MAIKLLGEIIPATLEIRKNNKIGEFEPEHVYFQCKILSRDEISRSTTLKNIITIETQLVIQTSNESVKINIKQGDRVRIMGMVRLVDRFSYLTDNMVFTMGSSSISPDLIKMRCPLGITLK